VYAEFGSPGRQIETILTMLKGTPYENPLATSAASRQPTPSNRPRHRGRLLNPSMMAEFKKSAATIGITASSQTTRRWLASCIRQERTRCGGLSWPPWAWPELRAAIEGMQTVTINPRAVVTMDKVIIYAQPHPAPW